MGRPDNNVLVTKFLLQPQYTEDGKACIRITRIVSKSALHRSWLMELVTMLSYRWADSDNQRVIAAIVRSRIQSDRLDQYHVPACLRLFSRTLSALSVVV